MGGCFSKKSTCSSCQTTAPPKPPPHYQINAASTAQLEKKKLDEEPVKKEIFIIKHRKSHDVDRRSEEESGDVKKVAEVAEPGKIGSDNSNSNNGALNGGGVFVAAPVRTSSCTKEEVDAILIQCGRLSRSSSTGKAANFSGSCGSGENNNGSCSQKGRKYSGSKRSYDFDGENGSEVRDIVEKKSYDENGVVDDENGLAGERFHRHRQRQRQSRTVGSPSKGRRRTPSREREQQQQRSGSRERGGGGGSSSSGSGRRVSRSPGRRSESPITTSSGVSAAGNTSSGNGNGGVRPGKMVSVPATVSSLAMDKSNNGGGGGGGAAETISASAVKRIQVKRNVGGADAARTAASPRARSPARSAIKVLNENQQQQQQQQPGSLSRSNSRKAENSPYRRNPLSEIDTNVVVTDQMPLSGTKASNNIVSQKLNADRSANAKSGIQGSSCNKVNGVVFEMGKSQQQVICNDLAVNVVASGPQAVTRSRSSRLSRDFDINPETLSNTSPSYTALLLEDIHNFHQKGSTSTTPAITFPPCLSKACSILEAVADLNSTTSSHLPSSFSDEKRRIPTAEQFNKYYENVSFGAAAAPIGKKGLEGTKKEEPFVQSEVVVTDDIMEPSFHKYVTMRRGTTVSAEDLEEQESSGSNSFVAGGQQHWVSPSSWEPNSADSVDCWTSSRRNIREENQSPLGFQRHAISELVHDSEEAAKRLNDNKKRDSDQQHNGIGRGRIGSRGQHSVTTVTAAAST